MLTELTQDAVPKIAVIGPYRYEIIFDGDAAYDYDYSGACLFRSKRLKLDPLQTATELPQVLLHEIIHALGHAYEIQEWERHKTDLDGKITDKINLMATALLTFIRTNPNIIRWMQEQA